MAPYPSSGAESGDTVVLSETQSVHGQTTLVWQGYPGFTAPYSGANSLLPHTEGRETFDATLFLGARLTDTLAFYVDPEFDQGFGLANTLGVAGFTSGEAYKVGHSSVYFRLPRAFARYVVNLGGDPVSDASSANVLAGIHEQDNVTVTVGKFSVPDLFDTNKYAHDPKGDFLNWSVIESGAFDYAADSWGYTFGAAADWTQSWWSLRAGLFDLSLTPNSPELETGLGQFSVVVEAEQRHQWWAQPGTAKLLVFLNRGYMGAYDAAVALGHETDQPANTALVRRYASRAGCAASLQQQVNPNLGAFVRASFNDGSKETFDFTDVNESFSAGLALQGTQWGRANDAVGLAGVVNGISAQARRYFAAGGLGVLVGDGQLPSYRPELIVETYYSYSVAEGGSLSVDYQFVDNPAYNAQRGPVSVFSVRAHAEF